jgi:hypothetical protein
MSSPGPPFMIESEPSTPRPEISKPSWLDKAVYAFAGIILPLVAFACASPSGNWAADTPWKSGDFWVYATLVLKWPAVWPFYPLLLFSMAALGLFLWDRARYTAYLVVRLGLYSGVVLALQFAWLIYAPTDQIVEAVAKTLVIVSILLPATALGLIPAMIAYFVLSPLVKRWGWGGFLVRAVLAAIPPVLLVFLISDDALDRLITPLVIVFLIMLAASPAWAFAAYACAAGSVFLERYESQRRWSLLSLLAVSTWATCLFGAWRRAMDLAIQEYASLPAENPNCFVCSAAARGHRQLVRSEPVCIDGSRVIWVNRQLRVLKAFELGLKIAAPRVHQAIRRTYNWGGPPLARRLKSPWAADVAYLALKPAEWIAGLVLRMLRIRPSDVARIYRRR